MNLVDWNNGMEQWSGVLDWTTGVLCPQYWQDRSWLQLNSIIVYTRYGVKISSRTGTRLGLAWHNINNVTNMVMKTLTHVSVKRLIINYIYE